jgi:hypothetical protein
MERRLAPLLALLLGMVVMAPAAAALAGGSSAASPTVRFPTPGVKTVTLTVCGAGGCSSVMGQITVLEPGPVITAFSVAPARAEIGGTVMLEASATGQPSLAYSWLVLRGGFLQGVLSGPSAGWSTRGAAPGIYTVRLIVSNGSGSAEADQDVLLVPEAASQLFTIAGCRLLDTRGGKPLRLGGAPLVIAVGGRCGIPPGARAVVAHAAVVGPTAAGFLSLFPGDYHHGLVSSVNFGACLRRERGSGAPPQGHAAAGGPARTAGAPLPQAGSRRSTARSCMLKYYVLVYRRLKGKEP